MASWHAWNASYFASFTTLQAPSLPCSRCPTTQDFTSALYEFIFMWHCPNTALLQCLNPYCKSLSESLVNSGSAMHRLYLLHSDINTFKKGTSIHVIKIDSPFSLFTVFACRNSTIVVDFCISSFILKSSFSPKLINPIEIACPLCANIMKLSPLVVIISLSWVLIILLKWKTSGDRSSVGKRIKVPGGATVNIHYTFLAVIMLQVCPWCCQDAANKHCPRCTQMILPINSVILKTRLNFRNYFNLPSLQKKSFWKLLWQDSTVIITTRSDW